MTTKSIQTGVDKITEALNKSTSESLTSQWRNIRNKIDSLLLSTTVLKTDEVRKACQEIDSMPADKRGAYISQKWGANCYQKVEPLLLQLRFLEDKMR